MLQVTHTLTMPLLGRAFDVIFVVAATTRRVSQITTTQIVSAGVRDFRGQPDSVIRQN